MSDKQQLYVQAGAPGKDHGFDEITLRTVPRFKESELSGDEWRTSVEIQFKKKGVLIYEGSGGTTMTDAALRLSQHFDAANKSLIEKHKELERFCAQSGCAKKATNSYLIKKKRCGTCGGNFGDGELDMRYVRDFCAEHSNRGDCDLEDCDFNYKLVEKKAKTETEQKSD